MFAFRVIGVISFFSFSSTIAQVELDLAETNMTESAIAIPPSPIPLRICYDEDALSNAYCKCTDKVVDCDFSKYQPMKNGSDKSPNTTIPVPDRILYGYQLPPSASRFCLCNTPKDFNLIFHKDHFLPYSSLKLQRFDLFNLKGMTKFQGGFSLNFYGDLYISNANIQEILSNEFGRGDNTPIPNLQDLKCCSSIKVSQEHEKPLLFIENSTISQIHTEGLTDLHLWKTLILKRVRVRNVHKEGIILANEQNHNVAIIDSRFENVSMFGIIFRNFSNLLLVKNYFKRSVNDAALWIRSSLNNSNILMMDNIFWNLMYSEMDAQKIVSWFNVFDVWDHFTFLSMKNTSFLRGKSSRSISINYNLVNYENITKNTLDFNGSAITFSKNVLGSCNCSLLHERDVLLKSELNYCFSGSVAQVDKDNNKECSIKLEKARKKCGENDKFDFSKLCKDKDSISGFPGKGMALKDDIKETKINSKFISRIVKEFQSYFGQNDIQIGALIVDHDPNHRVGKQLKNGHPIDGNSDSKKKGSPALPIFVALLITGFVIGAVILAYKYRHRFGGRRTHEILDGSQTTFI